MMKYRVGDKVRINEKYFINSSSEITDAELVDEHREAWSKHFYLGTVSCISRFPGEEVLFPYEVCIGEEEAYSFKEEELDHAIPLDLPSLSTYE